MTNSPEIKTVIEFSKEIFLKDLVTWNDRLWSSTGSNVIEFDFKNASFLTPMAMIFIAHQIRYHQRVFPRIKLRIKNYTHLTYPAHMGFFSCFGGNFGKEVGEAPGDMDYLPITVIDTSEFIKESGVHNVRDAIDSDSMRMARVLTRSSSGFAFDLIQYSLREIIRNIFEHSGSKVCMFCAQYWKNKNHVQIAIADEGQGVHSALTFNPKYKDLKERDALHFSLLPGVSGNFRDLQSSSVSNVWRNTGYGFYMTSRLCRNEGGFLLMSSNRALVLQRGTKTDFPMRNFQGTLVRLDLDVSSGTNLSAKLAKYAEEGKIIAQDIAGAKVIEASAASQMLSRDFIKAHR